MGQNSRFELGDGPAVSTASFSSISPLEFGSASLPEALFHTSDDDLIAVSFGLIGFSAADERVELYSVVESELSGLRTSSVIGRKLFDEVAPCMNNFMIAERFRSGEELDETVNYVFTLRMSPTPVRLRLIRRLGKARMYLCVCRQE